MAVQAQRKTDVERDARPIHARRLERRLAHHGMARFVPELAAVRSLVRPRHRVVLREERRHHLRHIHLEQALAQKREVALRG